MGQHRACASCHESALYEALTTGTIGGYISDVWWNDFSLMSPGSSQWPATKHDFSTLGNVWMTPHSSSQTPEAHQEALAQVAGNLDALALGQPLRNVVRPSVT